MRLLISVVICVLFLEQVPLRAEPPTVKSTGTEGKDAVDSKLELSKKTKQRKRKPKKSERKNKSVKYEKKADAPDWWEGWHHYFQADSVYVLVPKSSRDKNFKPSTRSLDVSIRDGGPEARIFTKVEGVFQKKGWNLLYGGKTVAGVDAGSSKFTIELELTGRVTSVTFRGISSRGEIKTFVWKLVFKQWTLFEKAKREEKPWEGRRPIWIATLGASSVSYEESMVSKYTMIALNAKIAYAQEIFGKSWELGIDLSGTLLPLSKNNSNATARFINGNILLGWILPPLKYPWRLKLAFGMSYSQSIVSNDAFGYTPIISPQLYPILQKFFSPRNQGYFYLKYVAMKEGISFFSFNERELGAGIGWLHFLRDNRPIIVSLDYSNIVFNIASIVRAKMSSVTLGFGYGF